MPDGRSPEHQRITMVLRGTVDSATVRVEYYDDGTMLLVQGDDRIFLCKEQREVIRVALDSYRD